MSTTGDRPAPRRRPGARILEIDDEREEEAREALALIGEAFAPNERQPLDQIAMEIAEKRLGLLTSYDFHLFAAFSDEGKALAVSAGVFLGGVNAGFVTYLAVRRGVRGKRLGRRLRTRLIEAFRADARAGGRGDLAWVVGEVRLENPWLGRLVRERAAIPFDFTYLHPGVEPGEAGEDWVLYRQPVGDTREVLPAGEVKQLLYAIWRRAYRVRWPLERAGFRVMLEEVEEKSTLGALPGATG